MQTQIVHSRLMNATVSPTQTKHNSAFEKYLLFFRFAFGALHTSQRFILFC